MSETNISPNISTYYSSHTEFLTTSLLAQLKEDEQSPVNNPFATAHILVPNSGMQRYLELQIAKEFGICSHIKIYYVGQFLSQSYRQLLGTTPPVHLDTRLLTFALLRLWHNKQLPLDSHFTNIFQQHQSPRQQYVLASNIAQLINQYLNERPQMIEQWQAGKLVTNNPHESWQRDIYQQLIQSLQIGNQSRLPIQKQFIDTLTDIANKPVEHAEQLPHTLHIFGFHAIPRTQLTELLAVGQITHINFYTFNPCIEFWLDIVPERIKTQLAITAEDEADLLTVGHPLLASWGQSGKYYIEQLNEFYAPNLDELVRIAQPDSVLTWLQNDIRNLANEDSNSPHNDSQKKVQELFEKEKEKEKHKDKEEKNKKGLTSISLHSCATPRREVEVLYDNLCRLFANDELNPADVLVIVPKLADYAPHIQAIFSHDKNRITIPYSLANQSSAESDADVQAFLSLLTLLDGDFQAQQFFETLNEERIKEELNLDQKQLNSIRKWFADSRFALHFYDNNNGESSSFEKLLDSLLLAFVGGENSQLGNRYASNLYNEGQEELLAKLCELWQRFIPFARLNNKQLTLSQWRDTLHELTDTFLPLRHAMSAWINDWYDALTEIDNSTVYDFATIKADFSAMLQNDTLYGPFLSGGVSFCAVAPMRCIPAKMIAVLGLNHNFPTIPTKNPLDLRTEKPLWSDKNPHKEQQYFFLETLMATREKLYLSHIGIDEKTGEHIPPSSLVCELLGYLERYIPHFTKTVKTEYPIQCFADTQSYQSLYDTPIEDASEKVTSNTVNNNTLNLPDTLTIKQFATYLCEPLSAFLQCNLGAKQLREPDEPLAEYEFISTENNLEKWQYKHLVVDNKLTLQENNSRIIQELQQKNIYAPYVITDALLTKSEEDMTILINNVKELELEENPIMIKEVIKRPLNDNLITNNPITNQSHTHSLSLHLNTPYYKDKGLVSYHEGKLDTNKILRAWIQHIAYHCIPTTTPAQSIVMGVEKNQYSKKYEVKTIIFKPLESNKAGIILDTMLSLLYQTILLPYPMTLSVSITKKKTEITYQALDELLYSQIPTVSENDINELQQQWQIICEEI